MKKNLSIGLITAILLTTSCTSLHHAQRQELAEWEAESLKVEHKNAALAAGLNVLPGFGDFYNGNIGLGIVNLLFWPASVLWAPVGGATGAEEANYYVTKFQVDKLTKKRQSLLNDLQAASMTKQITNDEYFLASQKVNTMQLSTFKTDIRVTDLIPRMNIQMLRLPTSVDR